MELISLRDPFGASLAQLEVTPGTPGPRAVATWFADGRAEQIAGAIATALAGHRVGVLDRHDVATALLDRGGVLDRHSFVMTLDLTVLPPSPSAGAPGISIAPLDGTRTAAYGDLASRSYPPEHPDHEPDDADPATAARTIEAVLRGEEVGHWMPEASLEASDDAGDIVGAIIVSAVEPDHAFDGGPWITDVFVDPLHVGRGIGRSLIAVAASRLAAHGHATLGLAVTVTNPAARLYEAMGFVHRHEAWRIIIRA